MHFDRDLHAMIGGEAAVLFPERRDLLIPLPFENVEVLGGPRTGEPVREAGAVAIAGAAGEIDDYRDAEAFGKQDRLAAHLAMRLAGFAIGMQGVPVATERADRD